MSEILMDEKDYDILCKERMDFGFDSIYFRYSEIVEELGQLKEEKARQENKPFDKEFWSNEKRSKFWRVLEKLMKIHEIEE